MFVCTGTVYGAVKHIPIRSDVVLKPGEAYTAEVESAKIVEIGWTAVQAKRCTMDCVQMTLTSGNWHQPLAVALGAEGNYTPTDGKVVVEYKNVSQEPVTIDVFRVERTCDAEACKLFDSSQKGRLLVFKVAEFKSITNSTDGSYSTDLRCRRERARLPHPCGVVDGPKRWGVHGLPAVYQGICRQPHTRRSGIAPTSFQG